MSAASSIICFTTFCGLPDVGVDAGRFTPDDVGVEGNEKLSRAFLWLLCLGVGVVAGSGRYHKESDKAMIRRSAPVHFETHMG